MPAARGVPRQQVAPMIPVVWLHGVGGPPRGPGWRLLLNRQLREQGFAPVRRGAAHAVDYQGVLLGAPARPGAVARLRDSHAVSAPARTGATTRTTYDARRAELEEALAPWRDSPPRPGLSDLPPLLRGGVASAVSRTPWMGFPLVRGYLGRPRRRRRVLASVLAQLPPGPVVLVAHSLGSVVALDLLAHLEPGRVRLLVTVGSPLALEAQHGDRLAGLTPFPVDRVDAWVNLHMRWDWITGGAPLDRLVPEVVDVALHSDVSPRRHHWRSTYLTHPAVAAAVGRARAW